MTLTNDEASLHNGSLLGGRPKAKRDLVYNIPFSLSEKDIPESIVTDCFEDDKLNHLKLNDLLSFYDPVSQHNPDKLLKVKYIIPFSALDSLRLTLSQEEVFVRFNHQGKMRSYVFVLRNRNHVEQLIASARVTTPLPQSTSSSLVQISDSSETLVHLAETCFNDVGLVMGDILTSHIIGYLGPKLVPCGMFLKDGKFYFKSVTEEKLHSKYTFPQTLSVMVTSTTVAVFHERRDLWDKLYHSQQSSTTPNETLPNLLQLFDYQSIGKLKQVRRTLVAPLSKAREVSMDDVLQLGGSLQGTPVQEIDGSLGAIPLPWLEAIILHFELDGEEEQSSTDSLTWTLLFTSARSSDIFLQSLEQAYSGHWKDEKSLNVVVL
jgi:hypothetical protein